LFAGQSCDTSIPEVFLGNTLVGDDDGGDDGRRYLIEKRKEYHMGRIKMIEEMLFQLE
jgi:hypothetical protein